MIPVGLTREAIEALPLCATWSRTCESRVSGFFLIRPSGTARYARTRAFDQGLGYSEHARVPD
jgi:hypothetical protein